MAGDRPQLVCPLPRRSHYYPLHHSSYPVPGASPTTTRARRTPSLTGGARPESVAHQRRRSSVSRNAVARVAGLGTGAPTVATPAPAAATTMVAGEDATMEYISKDEDVLSEFLSLFTPSSPPPMASRALAASPAPRGATGNTPTPTPHSRSSASPASPVSLARTPSSPGGPILVPISSVLPPRTISASPRQTRRVATTGSVGAGAGLPVRPRSRMSGCGIGATAPSVAAELADGENANAAHYAWLLGSPISRCRAPAPRASDMEVALAAFASLNLNPHASPILHPNGLHHHRPPSAAAGAIMRPPSSAPIDIYAEAAAGVAPESPNGIRLGSPALPPVSA